MVGLLMSKFEYQKKRKQESEKKIIQVFLEEREKGKSFMELLSNTKLSKPVLTERLKNMMKEGLVDKVLSEDKKRILYVTTEKLINSESARFISFFRSSVDGIFKEVEETFKNKSLSDKECFELLSQKISSLTLYALSLRIKYGLRKAMISHLSIMMDKLMTLPKERLDRIEQALNELYPKETSLLEHFMAKYILEKILR